ncbi:MAG TPA: low affinity iron permease family protein [Chthoniobacterales bacterium]|nr:low affinity iron permease family protein [Chthoniobacterales bacterium]
MRCRTWVTFGLQESERSTQLRFATRRLVAIARKTSQHNRKQKSEKRDFFCRVQDTFRIIAHRTAGALGSAWAFMAAIAVIVVWGLTGHLFHYSDTWQLIINTGTTIVTFLMVFLIQNTQNRDSKAIQLKLDELIRSLHGARNTLMDLETLSDADLDKFQKEFKRLRNRSEQAAEKMEELGEKAGSG